MAQDDTRENAQIKLFGLERKSHTNRGSKYTSDATLTVGDNTYSFELKTSKNNGIGSARGMDRDKIHEWKKLNDFFIFSIFDEVKGNPGFQFKRHVVCTEKELQWWFDFVIDKVHVSGHAGKLGLDEYEKTVRKILEEAQEQGRITTSFLKRMDKTMKVGVKYNSPNININKLIKNGAKELDLKKDLKQQLLDYIKEKSEKQ
tara:strand:- start:401 stop:1006 length:606 start_codon:yes stop_codon:yes gene_type:complete